MATSKKYIQPKMVNWYDTKQLAATGLRSVISGQFGHFADKREIQAALKPQAKAISFGDETELWIDYVSDTGDGFNSTYSIAKLVSEKNLKLALKKNYEPKNQGKNIDLYKDGIITKPGDLIIFGGDQVYPTPEMKEYDNRFKIPFGTANPCIDKTDKNNHPKMFAIPGNHDWYDGLGNFISLFCQKRQIGNWQTVQERSYFAIELPYNYWIFGIDVQLNSDIDQPQKEYFQKIAIDKMKDGDKVILCTAEPAWVYHELYREDESYKRLKYFETLYITDDAYQLIGKKFKLVATITGDLHHYSRYELEKEGYVNQLITAGGGGAFLHPTHFLPEKLTKMAKTDFSFEKSTPKKDPELKAAFPSKSDSWKLSFLNFAFPWFNKEFVLFLSFVELMLTWILQGTTYYDIKGSFLKQLANTTDLGQSFAIIFKTLINNPLFILISFVLIFGCMTFTDTKRIKRLNLFLGLPHGIIQWFNLMFWLSVFAVFLHPFFPEGQQMLFVISTTLAAALTGGIVGGFIFGICLWFGVYVLNVHLDEGFSSLAHQHYKNFLRLHITKDQLIIYPVGVDRVTTSWKQSGEGDSLKFEGKFPECHLIEPPIIIKNT
ncbi:MAG: metallophosphoesterase [Prolixibacteraceae bacterium]|nr:metallophosphoesterase [Prolixibacteraceae bacterium]